MSVPQRTIQSAFDALDSPKRSTSTKVQLFQVILNLGAVRWWNFANTAVFELWSSWVNPWSSLGLRKAGSLQSWLFSKKISWRHRCWLREKDLKASMRSEVGFARKPLTWDGPFFSGNSGKQGPNTQRKPYELDYILLSWSDAVMASCPSNPRMATNPSSICWNILKPLSYPPKRTQTFHLESRDRVILYEHG